MRLDGLLDDVDHDSTLGAAVLTLLATQAVEVRIRHALVIADDFDTQNVAALAAVQRSLEVVRTLPRLLTTLEAALSHILGSVPQALGDERRMLAGVLDVLERDGADVVTVLQDRIDVGPGQPRPGA